MTQRVPRTALNAVVVVLITIVLVLGSGWLASPASALTDAKRHHKQTRKHAWGGKTRSE